MPSEPIDDESPSATFANVPAPLKAAAIVVAAEGVLAAVMGVLEAFTIDSSRLVLGLTTAVFLTLYGVGLVVVARGLSRAATWSRGPAVFAQLIQLGVAWSFWGGSTRWVAVVLGVSGVVVLVSIFQRSSLDALVDDPTRR
ncbi:hypothetical protein OG394_37805 [Kribbella sp. NBC_01245]|uniref:hypothetical protein n=1 Tax=Kribbella sp. NBC_01245 TaxID=2903578 RepID=UPI002E2B1A14|nr:hypothetical protein [Kribbella sp. NBC_01245]